MNDDDLPTFEFEPKEEQPQPRPSKIAEQSTETIDLSELFSQPHFIGQQSPPLIETTSLGKLLHAIPIPSLIIDRNYSIVFCNEACEKFSANYCDIVGVHFADLVSRPKDPMPARELAAKANAVLDNAFRTRKAQRVEAILHIGSRKIWGCLHLRLIRIGSERHVLILIEDFTSERLQRILSQKAQRDLEKARDELQSCIDERIEDLERMYEELSRELGESRMNENILNERLDFYRELFLQSRHPVIVIDPEADRIIDANTICSTFYGYCLEELKNMKFDDLGSFQEDTFSFEFDGNCGPLRFRHRIESGKVLETAVNLTPVLIKGRRLIHFLIDHP